MGESKYIKNMVFHEEELPATLYERVIGFKVKKLLFSGDSNYQNILIFNSSSFGRMLVLDGIIQLSELDEFSYHEMLSFTTLCCHPNPKRVLILGGGDGGMVTQVIKFPSVEEIVVCDIDQLVVDKCREFFPQLTAAFDNPKCNLFIGDAMEHIRNSPDNSFDVVICDCTDPEESIGSEGLSNQLFGKQFFESVQRVLTKNGTFCTQMGNNMWQHYKPTSNVVKLCRSIFSVVCSSFVSVPCFTCGQNGFLVCSLTKGQNLSDPYWVFSDKTLDNMGIKYYDTNLHKAAFSLPRFAQKRIYNSEEFAVQCLNDENESEAKS